jgi:hypothetical protein
MSINITIKGIKKTDNLDFLNVITEIKYEITKEQNNKTASLEGFANLDFSELTEENYIPMSGITENIVKDWVLNSIGDRITSIEEYLDNELSPQEEEQIKIISMEIKLPWENN